MSWVESSATIRDGVAYVGSSDAAAAYAFDARTGARRWATDVFGWAWGQPAVTERRVYVGTSGQVGYPVPHAGGVLALDRETGAVRWHFVSGFRRLRRSGFSRGRRGARVRRQPRRAPVRVRGVAAIQP
jgi:outer membrane protein assembly factor BamB